MVVVEAEESLETHVRQLSQGLVLCWKFGLTLEKKVLDQIQQQSAVVVRMIVEEIVEEEKEKKKLECDLLNEQTCGKQDGREEVSQEEEKEKKERERGKGLMEWGAEKEKETAWERKKMERESWNWMMERDREMGQIAGLQWVMALKERPEQEGAEERAKGLWGANAGG